MHHGADGSGLQSPLVGCVGSATGAEALILAQAAKHSGQRNDDVPAPALGLLAFDNMLSMQLAAHAISAHGLRNAEMALLAGIEAPPDTFAGRVSAYQSCMRA
jgi:hypothetical protein